VDGARYVDTVLRALFDNSSLWESTALFLNYDENDGFFDHVLPPVAPPGTPLEYVGGRPIGLGPRVPMTVISPWSRGGWVSSEVYDHTSVIRFLERWTGVMEPNISDWRRAVTGDLTAAFDFQDHAPRLPTLPDTAALQLAVDQRQASLPPPVVPSQDAQRMPVQPAGSRPARALPYQPVANLGLSGGTLTVSLENHGSRPVQLAVYSDGAPSSHLLDGSGTVSVPVAVAGGYEVSVHGPNGFLRQFLGGPGDASVQVTLALAGTADRPLLRWMISNGGGSPARVRLADAFGGGQPARVLAVAAGASHQEDWDALGQAYGWYDLTFTVPDDPAFLRRFTGHLENGNPSRTHPGSLIAEH
jgi:phospholipase C